MKILIWKFFFFSILSVLNLRECLMKIKECYNFNNKIGKINQIVMFKGDIIDKVNSTSH
jgi:hypothetical protein